MSGTGSERFVPGKFHIFERLGRDGLMQQWLRPYYWREPLRQVSGDGRRRRTCGQVLIQHRLAKVFNIRLCETEGLFEVTFGASELSVQIIEELNDV